jgi:hypothetical protein
MKPDEMLPSGGKVLPPGFCFPPLQPPNTDGGTSTSPAARKPGRTQARASKRDSGRFASINRFVDGEMRSLPRAAALVWLCLWRDTKSDGKACTGATDLARRVRSDRSTVSKALKLLVDHGLLEVVRRGDLGRGVSVYRVK